VTRKTINIDLNRVEGDLEIALDIEDGVVVDARCVGVMYRGFEQIMIGRTPRDAAVITPRVCGICCTAQLYAGILALENVWQVPVPPNAVRIRELCLHAEAIQSDLRQSFLMFMVDFCNPKYGKNPLYQKFIEGFEPFKGRFHLGALQYSKLAVEIIAIFGGQWPHSSYMLPGGVVNGPNNRRVIDCLDIVDQISRWYERDIIGCDIDKWLAVETDEQFFHWLTEHSSQTESAVGLYSNFVRDIGLHQQGFGTPHMLSFGARRDPESVTTSFDLKQGVYNGDSQTIENLDQQLITEHVRHSWFRHYKGGRHPWEGETIPDYQPDSDRYTWAKAPRYNDKVLQTGPMAELYIAGEPLITSLHDNEGGNTWLRQFARLRRIGSNLRYMRSLLQQLAQGIDQPHFVAPKPGSEVDGQGFGMLQAARGALGHWIVIKDGVIERYQIVTPTSWNASPRDSSGQHGHWEQSLIGLKVDDLENPLMVGHIVRSHDPCLVCTVHMLPTGKRLNFGI
jgi:hydrogenase large subunit